MERCLIPDIYFDPRYGKTCELIEAGEAKTFEYASEQGRIIQRKAQHRQAVVFIDDIAQVHGRAGRFSVLHSNGAQDRGARQ